MPRSEANSRRRTRSSSGRSVRTTFPQDVVGQALIVMADDVADTGNLRPGYLRVPCFQLRVEMAAGLGDDFDAALDEPAFALVGLESLQRDACHFAFRAR